MSFVFSLIDTFRAALSHAPYVFPRSLSINSLLSLHSLLVPRTLGHGINPCCILSSILYLFPRSFLSFITIRPSTLVNLSFAYLPLSLTFRVSSFFCSLVDPFLDLTFFIFYLLQFSTFTLAKNQCCGSVNIFKYRSEGPYP